MKRNSVVKWLITLLMGALSFSANAGKDPIHWQLNHPFPSTVTIGQSYNITYVLTNQLPFTLKHDLRIDKTASPASEFTYADACTGKRLASKESCSIEITLSPQVVGTKYFQLVIAGYDYNRVALPQLTTVANNSSSSAFIVASVTTPLTSPLTFGNSSNYAFTFTNTGSETATSVTASSSVSGAASSCSTQLAGGNSCTLSGIFTPASTTPSSQSVTGTFSYAQGSAVSISTGTIITAPSGVTGIVVTALPPVMESGETAHYGFKFCNNYSDSITNLSQSIALTTGGGSLSTISGNCNTSSLSTTACCQININTPGVYTAGGSGAATVTATITFEHDGSTGTAAVGTSTTIGIRPTTKKITFTNQCSFEVWVSLSGAALPGGTFSSPCTSGSCPTGSACGSNGSCFWENYNPGTFGLTQNSSTSVTIANSSIDSTILWSGAATARTGCSGSSCAQANCNGSGGSASCTAGRGFSQPATQAEFTFLKTSIDTYDVTVINGFHLPVQMTPDQPVSISNYSCGAAGGNPPTSGFGTCAWNNAVLPNHQYYWVSQVGSSTAGTCTLTSTNTCNSGYLCGITSAFAVACGKFLGFWTGDQVCYSSSVPTNIRNQFSCDVYLSTLTTYPPTGPSFSPTPTGHTVPLILQDLMGCKVFTGYTGPVFNTCYLIYPTSSWNANQISSCCGCTDWWTDTYNGSLIGANSNTDTCLSYGANNTDPVWTSYIKNTIIWMKAACPSVYTYPFDDKTSTFTCTNNSEGSSNTTNYTITFCPGGDSGLPSGILDGR